MGQCSWASQLSCNGRRGLLNHAILLRHGPCLYATAAAPEAVWRRAGQVVVMPGSGFTFLKLKREKKSREREKEKLDDLSEQVCSILSIFFLFQLKVKVNKKENEVGIFKKLESFHSGKLASSRRVSAFVIWADSWRDGRVSTHFPVIGNGSRSWRR